MPSIPCSELHSASTSSPLNSSNISNVNRFYTQSTTNLSATPASAANCLNTTTSPHTTSNLRNATNSSLTALTTTSTASQFLELPNTSVAADIAVAAAAKAAYDLAGLTASFHRSQTHPHSHPSGAGTSSVTSPFGATYLGDCGVEPFANGLTSWEVAHQSAAAFAAASHHQYPHPLSSFNPHCDIRTAFALSVPSTSAANCGVSVTSSSVPAMTVQRVTETIRANSAVNSNATLPHQNANILTNGISSNFTISVPNKTSKPRRRVATIAQRRAANIRERRRMFNLNSAFDKLRKKVPTFAYEKRLSRIETLRLAIMYIGFMTEVIRGKDPCFEPRIPLHPSGSFQNHRDRDHLWNGGHYPFNTFNETFQASRF